MFMDGEKRMYGSPDPPPVSPSMSKFPISK
jgi:hypothetical protein